MNKKAIGLIAIPIIVLFVIFAAIVMLPVEKKGNGDDDDENGGLYIPAGAKKAIVLCSANNQFDFGFIF